MYGCEDWGKDGEGCEGTIEREETQICGVPPPHPDNIIVMSDSKSLVVLAPTTFSLREIRIFKLLLIRSLMTGIFCHNYCLK